MEHKRERFTKLTSIILLIGVMLIPVIYAGFYLADVWDPYAKADCLPVAVVNEDKGAKIGEEEKNLGQDLVKELGKSKNLDWQFVDRATADAGLKTGNQYYAVIYIPEDFSACIASASEQEKTPATIVYSSNEKRNYIATTIMKQAILTLQDSVKSSVSGQITDSLVKQLESVPDSLETLESGLGQLQDGSKELQTGITQLSDGGDAIAENLGTLSSSMTQVVDGAEQMHSGLAATPKLVSGMEALDSGAKNLSSGAATLSGGISQVKDGTAQLSSGSDALVSGAQQVDDGAKNLHSGAQQVDAGAQNLQAGIAQAHTGAQSLTAGSESLTAGLQQAQAGAAQLAAGAETGSVAVASLADASASLSALLGQLSVDETGAVTLDAVALAKLQGLAAGIQGGLAQLNDPQSGIPALSAGASALSSSMEQQLIPGAQTLQGGAESLENGLAQLSDGAATLTAGTNALSAGAETLAEGTGSLATGAAGLQDGVKNVDNAMTQLHTGAQDLTDGTTQLASGAAELSASGPQLLTLQEGFGTLYSALGQVKDGSDQLHDGAVTLSSGLHSALDGSNQLTDGLSTAEQGVAESIGSARTNLQKTTDLSEFVENSVEMVANPFDAVENYGTGFAPFFMNVALWTGGLTILMSVYLDYKRRMKVLSPESDKPLVRMGVFYALATGAALIEAGFVQFGLGLQIHNVPMYYIGACLASVTYLSIELFFFRHLGDVGKIISMLLLVLQLTSTGGMFPVEMTPGFFQFLNPLLPMTYDIQLMKEVISGGNTGMIVKNALVVLGFLIGFTILTLALDYYKLYRKGKRAPDGGVAAQGSL